MTFLASEIGYLKVQTEWRDDPEPGYAHAELVGVEWQGPPVTFIEERQLDFLTGQYIKPHPDLIEIGPYVLRRVGKPEEYARGCYWLLVGKGEWYWLRWRIRQGLERIMDRLVLTLAVWGLANWPAPNRRASWADVVARWRK